MQGRTGTGTVHSKARADPGRWEHVQILPRGLTGQVRPGESLEMRVPLRWTTSHLFYRCGNEVGGARTDTRTSHRTDAWCWRVKQDGGSHSAWVIPS